MTAEECQTNLLEDVPSTIDAFGSPAEPGAHHRVARVIAELVRSTAGGKVIGLEGGWGAGKSTVVGMARSMLEGDATKAKTLVATFDAWAHEGDPLRRTYLETLIHKLRSEKWIDPARWDRKLAELSNRRKETRTRTTSATTALGRWLAVTILIVPFGAIFMTSALRDGVTVNVDNPVSWYFWIGLLAGAPLVVLLTRFLYLFCKPPIGLTRIKQPEAWAFIEGKATQETQAETTETPNPTSLEFETYFDELMKDALDVKESRRIVLVLDNLDRVDVKDALAIWSTLQTFLQHHQRRSEGWFKKLWILVPFDPIGFRRLWDNRSKPALASSEVGAGSAADLVSDSFLDKSFQIRFAVPPLVLSDWKSHLFSLLQQALPDHPEADRHAVYRVFEQFRTHAGEGPTPRQLKLFVNQIGALHRQWVDRFPLAHLAYFVLVCRDRGEFISRLRFGDLPPASAARMLDPDLKANLAGLAFGVTAGRGQEILLTEPIVEGLSNGKVDEMQRLAEAHQGFWLTLETVAQDRFFNVHGSVLARIGWTLDTAGLLTSTRYETMSVRRALRDAANILAEHDRWGRFDEELAKGLASLCVLVNDPSFTAARMQMVCASLASEKVGEGGSTRTSLVETLLKLFEIIERLGHLSSLPDTFKCPFDIEAWKIASAVLLRVDASHKYWRRIKPAITIDEILGAMPTTISAGQFSADYLPLVEVTYESQDEARWNPIVDAFRERLNSDRNTPPVEAGALLHGLWLLRRREHPRAAGALVGLADNGHCLHHLFQAFRTRDIATQAICLKVFATNAPDLERRGSVGNAGQGFQTMVQALASREESLVGELSELTARDRDFEWLLRCREARGRYEPLLAAVAVRVLENDNDHRVMPAADFIDRWDVIKDAFGEDGNDQGFVDLVRSMLRNSDLCRVIAGRKSGFEVNSAGLYLVIAESSEEEGSSFLEWCSLGLQALRKNDWAADLVSHLRCIRLVLVLQRHVTPVPLNLAFADSLLEHAEFVASGSQIPPVEFRSQWDRLTAALEPEPVRIEFLKGVLRVMIKRDGEFDRAVLELYGRALSNPDVLSSNEDVFSRIFSRWVKDGSPDYGLEWMNQIFNSTPEFWAAIKNTSAAQEFGLRLRAAVPGGEGAANAQLLEAQRLLGLQSHAAPKANTADVS